MDALKASDDVERRRRKEELKGQAKALLAGSLVGASNESRGGVVKSKGKKSSLLSLSSSSSSSSPSVMTTTTSIPRCVDPIPIMVQLENSGRWPSHPEAFLKMKAAIGVQLAEQLQSSFGYRCVASEQYVDVFIDGFAFRVMVYSGRDAAMKLKADNLNLNPTTTTATSSSPSPSASSSVITPLSAKEMLAKLKNELLLENMFTSTNDPYILSAHQGLVSSVVARHPSFAAATRMAKRWVAAQMMSNHLPDPVVDLLVAAVYTFGSTSSQLPPASRVSGFARFLNLLGHWPWAETPLVVDPNG
eukprot:CAMPEP_0175062280 /NCGR_PEP_ID=MMETSP0052_2-20121109/14081_1 /TAXON_ID=51329 ORGANISM="Polytomella parva, Strain SAG 63-3" /NCGR_SAMPLE_ID=MMETSP0052_2 /ASSEMBLY_ACC=CAM_ASM_000194 /LENGTH=302 /DNA_ID=CAMNT_0016328285 /DNA_START=103 /DNA_END=1007 /DNA_ORIENTATION=-